jgi:hypothetical protein
MGHFEPATTWVIKTLFVGKHKLLTIKGLSLVLQSTRALFIKNLRRIVYFYRLCEKARSAYIFFFSCFCRVFVLRSSHLLALESDAPSLCISPHEKVESQVDLPCGQQIGAVSPRLFMGCLDQQGVVAKNNPLSFIHPSKKLFALRGHQIIDGQIGFVVP